MNAVTKTEGHIALPVSVGVWDGSHPLLLLDGWALTADDNQWKLCRARGKAGKWQPISSIGSNKRVLRRVMRERGVNLTQEAEDAVNALPDDFRIWHRRHHRASL